MFIQNNGLKERQTRTDFFFKDLFYKRIVELSKRERSQSSTLAYGVLGIKLVILASNVASSWVPAFRPELE